MIVPAEARARIGGTLVRLNVREGDFVRRGQVIGVVSDSRLGFEMRAYAAQASAAQAEAVRAQADLGRIRDLYQHGVYAKARLDQAEAAARAARGSLDAARAQTAASAAKPFVMLYLAGIGLYLGYKAIRHNTHPHFKDPQMTAPLALVGGFLDAAGGGGWGPVVTSNLLVQGSDPRKTIGTVNTAEFLLTLTISATFLFTLGIAAFTHAVIGLIIGGIAAAPFGAYFAKHIKPRLLLGAVSVVLIATSLFTIVKAWPIL